MRFLFATILLTGCVSSASAAMAKDKRELIAWSPTILVVEISQVSQPTMFDAGIDQPVRHQTEEATVIQAIRGTAPQKIKIKNYTESWEDGITLISKGRFLAFLKKDGDFYRLVSPNALRTIFKPKSLLVE